MKTLVAEIHSTGEYGGDCPTYLTLPLTEDIKKIICLRTEKFDAEKILDSELSSFRYDVGGVNCYDGDWSEPTQYLVVDDFGSTDEEVENIEILEIIIYGSGDGIVFRGLLDHDDVYWESGFIPMSVFKD